MRPNISSHFTKVLDQNRQKVFAQLAQIADNWYLAGGTALAMQLGHRISYDFYFFSQTKISTDFRNQVVGVFGDQVRFSMDTVEQLTFFDPNGVKITYAYTPYAPIYPLEKHDNIQLESVADIAADKAFTIGRRGALRDYVDLYYLLDIWLRMEQVISDAKKKYKAMFEEKLFLEQLVYLDDVDEMEIEVLDKHFSLDKMQEKLEAITQEYINSRLS